MGQTFSSSLSLSSKRRFALSSNTVSRSGAPVWGKKTQSPHRLKRNNRRNTGPVRRKSFIISSDCLKSDYDQEVDLCQPSHLYQTQSGEYGQGASLPTTSSEKIKAEPDGEGYRVLELTSDSQPLSAVNPDCSPIPSENREGVKEEETEHWIRFKPLKSKKAQKITSQSYGIWKKGRKSTVISHLSPHSQSLTPCWCGVCGNKCYSVTYTRTHMI